MNKDFTTNKFDISLLLNGIIPLDIITHFKYNKVNNQNKEAI